jgi:serine/threonine protein kinase
MRITDFGIAKIFQNINSTETSGTPGYMSPEVIIGHNHNQVVDYFALGVLTYEFMMGKRPYTGKNRREIKEKIISSQFIIQKDKIPEGWSYEAADFINKLLQRKPANRLGLRSAKEVKDHPWIKKYPWADLYNKKIIPSFKPPEGDNFDKKYCNQEEKINAAMKAKYEKYLYDPNYANAFDNFDFYGELLEEMKKNPKCKISVKNGENFIKEEFIQIFPNKNLDNQNDKNIIIEENEEEIEKKIVKNIQESNSSSNQLLMRHYKNIENSDKNFFIGNINEFNDYQNDCNKIDIIPDNEE